MPMQSENGGWTGELQTQREFLELLYDIFVLTGHEQLFPMKPF